MAIRSNHYDVAFEEFLRQGRTPYVAVDEQRRALLRDASLKSMDFIVYSQQRPNLLVDVKGRQFPTGGESGGHCWENWATEDDLTSLMQWEQVFGPGFRSILVFAYHILDERRASELGPHFEFRDRRYSFFGVWAEEYRKVMRTRSTSWETVSLPVREFRQLCSPIHEFL
ncbi:MAG: HYExAFE family protein [Planctomycetaceae bacterium]